MLTFECLIRKTFPFLVFFCWYLFLFFLFFVQERRFIHLLIYLPSWLNLPIALKNEGNFSICRIIMIQWCYFRLINWIFNGLILFLTLFKAFRVRHMIFQMLIDFIVFERSRARLFVNYDIFFFSVRLFLFLLLSLSFALSLLILILPLSLVV